MSQIIATGLIFVLMWSLKQFEWLDKLGGSTSSSTMTVGFILLIGYMAGKAAFRFKLPRITGYMLVGILVGPYVFDLVSQPMTRQLDLINNLALSLIALTAGGELKIRELKALGKPLFAITLLHMVVLMIVFVGGIYFLKPWIPFLEGGDVRSVLVVGMILGTIAMASSPAVAMALINECRSHGEVTESVLGVTVLKDIIVIMLFSVVLTLGRAWMRPDIPVNLQFLATVGLEIMASIGVGVFLGYFITLYLRYVNAENTLFLIGVCFLSAETGLLFKLEPALIALSAGFFMENVFPEKGERLVHAIEQGSLPVYTLFFCLAGAVINMEALREMWLLALVLVMMRLLAVFVSTYAGAKWGSKNIFLAHYSWLGFIAQAGVSLGLAAMLLRGFPEWGGALQTLIIAMIAINQLIGPIGFRFALIRSKEAHF
ncbi:MAG: cation:proton antiporter [Candidatus Omnitrophica bacterium]|nr:cation:proton antiporter [Candidatus Omnitrophota bacterium]